MTSTIEQFRETLLTKGLLCEEELDSIIHKCSQWQVLNSPEALGKHLVNKEKLTPYQAQKILQEQADELQMGQYIILDVIRNGAMGVVYRARHPRMKRDVALKVILSKLADNPDCVARFHREVHLAARLNHPNIVTAFDAAEDNGRLFLVMEYIEGSDLKTIINKQGGVSIEDAVDFITQAAHGLKYAHGRGVIHRDVKPSNLLLDKTGKIKILDVGLAMEESNKNDSDLTLAGGLLGSVNYMAPEQARDARDADARSDIYSLGCTLWYLLAGTFIYEEKTIVNRILAHRERPVPDLESLGVDIPAELQLIFQKMVAKHPDDRYQSVAALLEDLEPLHSSLCSLADEDHLVISGSTSRRMVQDADHLRHASDHQVINLSDDTLELVECDDPTRVSYKPAQPRRSSAAAIVIGGFALGCLAMVVIQILERTGHIEFQQPRPVAPATENEENSPAIGKLSIAAASADISTAHEAASRPPVPESDRPIAADIPFSPEQARTHQQQWADHLGLEAEQTNSLGMKMILIPPGTYQMGSDENDLAELVRMFPDKLQTIAKQIENEMPQHFVTLTRPYYISAHVVTFAQFQQFVNKSGYQLQDATAEGWKNLLSNRAPAELNDVPVRHICWNDAVAFCDWLSDSEDRPYRLPTDAEWEYACRAGSQELFGHHLESLYEQEWWHENANWPHAVGLKQANAFGLYDSRGNIREFCQDYYTRFSRQDQTDPLVDTPTSKDHRVVRGGGASCELYEIRPGRRNRVSSSDLVVSYIGFRVVSPAMLPADRNVQTARILSASTTAEDRSIAPAQLP